MLDNCFRGIYRQLYATSIIIWYYLVFTDQNKYSGGVNYTNLGGISYLPGIIIHDNLFKIFLMHAEYLVSKHPYTCLDHTIHLLIPHLLTSADHV
jgi:hypothetical protein